MPFAALAVMRDERGLAVLHRSNGTSLQTAPRRRHRPQVARCQSKLARKLARVESPAAAAKPQIDLDEMVEKAWQKLMRKLTIERERRGYTRWA